MANIFDLFKQIEKETPSLQPITHIVAGLGNYGREYEGTRHNSGFIAMDVLSSKLGVNVNKYKFDALTAEAVIEGKRVLLMKPQLYMNRSGESIKQAADFYKIPAENVVVMCDDVNLDVGKIRIRRKGSDGGQKGLRDIIYQLVSDSFPRVRIGVGKLPAGGDMVNWVLGRIPKELGEDYMKAVANACEAVPMIIAGNIDGAMCNYN